ncbi:hypothetical protein ACUN22_34810 [Streptomyces anulatus]
MSVGLHPLEALDLTWSGGSSLVLVALVLSAAALTTMSSPRSAPD